MTLKSYEEFSNLTFGGYLAGTTPVLSARSSSFSVLSRSGIEYVRTMRLTGDFLASLVGAVCGEYE